MLIQEALFFSHDAESRGFHFCRKRKERNTIATVELLESKDPLESLNNDDVNSHAKDHIK